MVKMLQNKFTITISLILLTFFSIACSSEKSAPTQSDIVNKSEQVKQDENCIEFQKIIHNTYNFKPADLSSAEQTAKSAEMDAVWNKVKADRKTLIPCLKKAIAKKDANNFFIFDASNLLVSIDNSDESKELLIKSFAKVDLDDVNPADWIKYIALLGYEGFDTSTAGENWLKSSNVEYTIPQHGNLKVTKETGALIIYGSMEEKFATPALAKLAADEKSASRETVIELLMMQTTPKSFESLETLNKNGLSEKSKISVNNFFNNPKIIQAREGIPKITREQYLEAFQEIVEGKSEKFMKLAVEVTDGEKDAVAVMKEEDIPLIRRARRYFALTANPHSPEWYQSFTDILIAIVKKNNLESQNKSIK